MMNRRQLLATSAAGLACSAMGAIPYGSAQPGGKIARMLVGFPAGGNADFVARLLTNELKGYSSTIIVENRPGAVGRLALVDLKSSAADGSTMILSPAAMIGLFPHIYKSLKYDPFADFIPVTMVCSFPYLVSVGPVVPDQVKTIADFFAWCRANPQLATYGTGVSELRCISPVSCWLAPPDLNLFTSPIRARRAPFRTSWEAKSRPP
jgi:tripartite-type tricarboxylate transporter receptor subunit TctC